MRGFDNLSVGGQALGDVSAVDVKGKDGTHRDQLR